MNKDDLGTWCLIIMTVVWLLTALYNDAQGQAPERELPRDDRTALALSIAVAAESGLPHVSDHEAIPNVLARRWNEVDAFERWSFYRLITKYCSVFKIRESRRTRRQKWAMALTLGPQEPMFWTPKASWAVHGPQWTVIVQKMKRFLSRGLPDPCRGRALHWGSSEDPQRANTKRVRCGADAVNRYYAVTKKKRSE